MPPRDLHGPDHRSSARVRVVGIGASAGGLVALEAFLAHVPPRSGLAYVVVQHLDPTRKAMLVELLQRATVLPVCEAADAMPLRADAVYVIPPNQDLTLAAGVLHLHAPAEPRGLRLPIDRLFSSLARDAGEQAIGVVLSGMGADGSAGLQAIHALGGLTLAQSPDTAQFESMPQNAMATGCVDIVAPAEALPERILRVTGTGGVAGSAGAPGDASALAAILRLLREHTRHDLSDYKPSTLRRRIERRQAVHGLDSQAAYADFVRANPGELDLLFKEMLIGVTRLFRDPDVWDELRTEVMPALLARATQGVPLRAWVVGCSSGEEAYTLAMVFAEAVEAMPAVPAPAPTMQIFASDLGAEAIAAARRGHYPGKIAEDVGPDRLRRFFRPQGTGFQIAKPIRDMVLFAQHDVILDPPFTRLDLLSCRNLMIYFNAALQRRLLPLFGYSLRAGGALLLGGSETVGSAQSLFTPASARSRLYWRSDQPLHAGSVDFPVGPRKTAPHFPEDIDVTPSPPQAANLQAHAEQALLRAFAPAAVLVNDQGDVVYINGSVGRYLEPAAGKANWNIHVMARPAIRAQIAVALRQALRDGTAVALPGLRLSEDAAQGAVDVTVTPVQEPAAVAGLVLVAFKDAAPVARRSRKRTAGAGDVPPALLMEELQRCKDEIQALRREMASSAEELQAANEALQSTNEELQSANEELTTSKEESQSMNEELQTLNQELQTKLDDLALAHSDMQNLLNSTDIATLFLDNDLHVRRFTDQITRIVHLRESDIGRPLTDLASTLNYPDLDADARQTLKSLAFSEKEITTTDGHWYMVRIKPYRTLADLIQGVVITFIDITAAKALESRLRQR